MDKKEVYIIQMGKYFKIGVSKDSITRLKNIDGTLLPEKPQLLYVLKSNNAYKKENELHKEYKIYSVRGEWFFFNNKILQEIVLNNGFNLINKPKFNINEDQIIDVRLKKHFKKEIKKLKKLKKEYNYLEEVNKAITKPLFDYILFVFKQRLDDNYSNIWTTAEEITVAIKTQEGNLKLTSKN